MGMYVDRAGHHHMAGDVDFRVGPAALGGDDASVPEPDVADAVPSGRRIDDMTAAQHRQQNASSETCARMPSSACATLGALDGALAGRAQMAPISCENSTAS